MGSARLAFETLEDLDSVRLEWDALAEARGNLFSTWEWASTWWRHFGRSGMRLRLGGLRRPDGSLAAILPLYEASHGPVRIARLLGHGPADELGPVAGPAELDSALAALAGSPRMFGDRIDVVLAERLPSETASSPELAAATLVRRESSPVIDIAGLSWDDFLASRSANFRSQVRRRERKLVREHAVGFRLSDRERFSADFEAFLRLHDARWGDESRAFGSVRRAFHREFAALALERGWLRLWLAESAGQTVAAWYGFRFGGAQWYYQAGRDPAWDSASVGSVLLAHTIRDACEAGLREYRLLLGDEAYKDRFATADPGIATVALAGSRRGRLAVSTGLASQRLPHAAAKAPRWLINRRGQD